MHIDKGSLVSEQSESRSSEAPAKRRPYQPPRLVSVDLAADEVLAIGCKTPVWGNSPLAPYNCTAKACRDAGS
jgi:hypothetical protein